MDTMEAIYTRRSIRKYTKDPIPDDLIQELIKAAVAAPSAGDQQPWQFVIIDDAQIKKDILTFHPNAKMLVHSPVAILICIDLSLETFKNYAPLDCAAATQNLLLAAHAHGLGACWLGIYPREDRITQMRVLIGIPSHIVPFSLIALGYPNETKGREDRYDETRIHHNTW